MKKQIDEQYVQLLGKLLYESDWFEGRNGGTRAIINRPLSISWDMSHDYFPILAFRKQNINHYINEFLWEINGGDDINDLNDYYFPEVDSRFLWKAWASEEGTVPYSYGACWRRNGEILANHSVDQIKMIEDMIKKDPMSRRLFMITSDVAKNAITNDPDNISFGAQYPPQVPPCHPAISFTSNGHMLNCHVFSRSQDIICGLPGDMIRYDLMTRCFAKIANLKPGVIWFSFTNLHYYREHEEKLLKLYHEHELNPENKPKIKIIDDNQEYMDDFLWHHFELSGYKPSKFVSFPLIV